VYPEELKSKVYLLKHFERYIMDRLYGEYEYTFEDVGRTKDMEWVQKYLRMKHVIVFKLSHNVLQVRWHLFVVLSLRFWLIEKLFFSSVQFLRSFKAHSLLARPSCYPYRQELQDDAMDTERGHGDVTQACVSTLGRRARADQV
jgi:hypothetical protein